MISVRACLAALLACAMCAPVFGHPHNGDTQTLVLRGTITDIDLKNGTLALDAIDRDTKKLRNFFVLLDPKIKITRAKQKMAVTQLAPGQAIICVVEVEVRENGQKGRMIAFDIQFDLKAKAATN
jgi:hypothetical protein